MTVELIGLFVILFSLIVLFLTEWLPVDLSALLGVVILTLTGYLTADQAFSGFSSPAVLTLIATFFLGAALRRTGVAESVAHHVNRAVGSSELFNIIAVMLVAALLSAFMSNVAATAVLLPAVVSIAYHAEISPSRLLIPLAFGAVLGGTTTLIGTAPNILMGEVMRGADVSPFEFFDFTPFGIGLVIIGTLYMAFFGRHLLPKKPSPKRAGRRDLKTVYQLQERLFSLRVPSGTSLVGQTLAETGFGKLLDAQVIAVVRGEQRRLVPQADEVLRDNDLLIVRGKLPNVKKLLRYRGLRTERLEQKKREALFEKMKSVGFRLTDDSLTNWTIENISLRKRYGVLVSAVQQAESFIFTGLAKVSLQKGDVVHVIGTEEQIARLSEDPYFTQVESEIEGSDFLQAHLFVAEVTSECPLVGETLKSAQVGELTGLTILGIERAGELALAVSGRDEIRAGDNLIVSGESDSVLKLAALSELEIDSTEVKSDLESSEIGIMEVVLAPRSRLIDQTLREINFRDRYGFQVLALWREGRPVRSRVAVDSLRFGDALLLQGPRKKMSLIADDPDFVVLTETVRRRKKTEKAPFAVMGLLLMVALSAFRIQPVHMCAFCGAVFVLLSGACSMQEAYREVEWRVVFLIAGLIPLGIAFRESGADQLVAQSVLQTFGDLGPISVLIAFTVLASFISQALDGTLTVVLLGPIGIQVANSLQISSYPILMGITLSASVAFLTPFSHKANLLVMGAGGYQPRDYFRVGVFLTIIAFILLWIMLPWVYPLNEVGTGPIF